MKYTNIITYISHHFYDFSATLEHSRFSEYFNNAPVFQITGRTFPVEILYANYTPVDYAEAAVKTVMKINTSEPAGDILVFLTGQVFVYFSIFSSINTSNLKYDNN